MRILAIESSSKIPTVAVMDCPLDFLVAKDWSGALELSVEQEKILDELLLPQPIQESDFVTCRSRISVCSDKNYLQPINCSSQLIPAIEKALTTAKIVAAEIGLVTVAKGPGSFTGLRIGLVAAKTLAFATGCSAVGVGVFDALYCQALAANQNSKGGIASKNSQSSPDSMSIERAIHVATDAGRHEIFSACYRNDLESRRQTLPFQSAEKPQLLNVDQWLESIAPGDLVTGLGLKLIDESEFSEIEIAPVDCWAPKVETIGKLGLYNFLTHGSDDIFKLEPVYSRISAAEEAKKR